MNTKYIYLLLLLTITVQVLGQGIPDRGDRDDQDLDNVGSQVAPEDRLRSWRLLDDFTLVDSLRIDTATAGVQQYNPIYKESFSNIHLGNMGSAYTSNLLSHKKYFNEFIFLNSLQDYFVQPDDIKFYNSKVPYTNLTYIFAGPRRRSEENVSAFFTQNVNRNLNLGFKYNLLSTVGLYRAQQVDNRNFNFFVSYTGNKYSFHTVLTYNKAEHYQNGGIENDSVEYITHPERYGYDQAENIPVKYSDAISYIDNYQLFFTHSLGIGKIKLNRNTSVEDSISENSSEDLSEEIELPVSTVYHTLHLTSYKRSFKIDNLSNYFSSGDDPTLPIFDTAYVKTATADTSRYTNFKNTFQIKFNEEANSLLKFGLRAFIVNEIKHYKFQIQPTFKTVEEVTTPVYRSSDTTFVVSHIGGQIFKNIGKNFWWNLGGRLYIQGYKAGDIELEGNLNTLYKVFKDTAGVYGRGKIDLRTPEFFQEKFYSNHIMWDKSFKQEKIINMEFGLNIPTRNLKLAFESKSLTDYIYWNKEAVPDQTTDLINAFQVSLFKKFKFGPFHSNNKLAYQYTSNENVYPLPEFVGMSSNYFNFYLAKRVLNVQVGMDVKYHTEYYTPAYMPATGQYYVQNETKIGNYPFMDAFVNFQLKRARIFLKFDHINQSFLDRNYFLTVGYPHSPMRFKWGISWNFYD